MFNLDYLAKKAAAAATASLQSKRLKGKSYREAVEKAQVVNAKSPVQKEKKPINGTNGKVVNSRGSSLTGRIVEVYIQTVPPGKVSDKGTKSSISSAASTPPETEPEFEAYESTTETEAEENRKPQRRASSKKSFVISSDSEDESNQEASKKRRKAVSKKPVRKSRKDSSDMSSDYEAGSSDESGSELSDGEESAEESVSSSDETTLKKRKTSKNKGKAIPKVLPRPQANGKKSASSSSEVDMDIDTDGSTTKKATKRKAVGEDKRPVKKQKRVDSDPWKLETSAVQEDWTNMKAPPLEMFHFARKVVDEYTYLDGKVHCLVTKMTAERSWVLSGTPPIHDFGALKTIAAFLNLHLGVDDDAEGQSAEIKKRRREQTGLLHHLCILMRLRTNFSCSC